ncbi:hypothetical protein K1T71_005580 [Dendrolimus kikuchii]|uniref:Uncharacterized protein n=1 Tax=Dendrolimus kikuchii TaxID=765133 RepID=A0ACC1D4U1_9NEOP|nr:hypothetical protein K1T71_005580 [Dendrolimus kikuchii]
MAWYTALTYAAAITCCFLLCKGEKEVPPNIVMIVADDMGWDDVSFHGSDQIMTPNIDLLAYSGIALGRYYSHCVCTPSRAALLTGKYGYKTGMQGYPLTNSEDRGLPVSEKLLPEYLKELGYATHLVGKWHLGQARSKYLPTVRGFDSHFGHRCGYVDYYEYSYQERWITGSVSGICLFRNLSVAWDAEGYLTDLYTNEAKSVIKQHDETTPLFLMVAHNAPHSAHEGALLQAPPEDIRAMRHVELPERRIYAAMMKKLDDSVGDIVEALLQKGILEKTIIVFISDNGGMTSGKFLNYASNWPLRGLKMSPYEGGVRVAGLIWNSGYWGANHLWNGYMHVVDWLPTLLRAAGSESPLNIDGLDLWDSIHFNRNSPREEIFEIDDYDGFASYTSGDFKLIISNNTITYSDHQGDNLRGIIGNKQSYENAIKLSKIYTILNEIHRPFQTNDTNLRDRIKIKCSNRDKRKDEICHPEEGKVCLFNIKNDPCEIEDLTKTYPEVVDRMWNRLREEITKKISRVVPLFRDPRSEPKLFNYTWNVWADNI